MASTQWMTAFWPLRHTHKRIASPSILEQVGILSPDGAEVRAVKHVLKLTTSSPTAKVAPTEMAQKAGPDKTALLKGQFLVVQFSLSHPGLHQGPKPVDPHRQLIIRLTTDFAHVAQPMMLSASFSPVNDAVLAIGDTCRPSPIRCRPPAKLAMKL